MTISLYPLSRNNFRGRLNQSFKLDAPICCVRELCIHTKETKEPQKSRKNPLNFVFIHPLNILQDN